jgi:hypothetical protein
MIDMENLVVEALEAGAKTEDEVMAHVAAYTLADRQYVRELIEQFYGPSEPYETEIVVDKSPTKEISLDDALPF